MHRTLQQEATRPAAATLPEQQTIYRTSERNDPRERGRAFVSHHVGLREMPDGDERAHLKGEGGARPD